jgi:eukaryotic-like serine/threonine-protein kinase
VPLVIATRLGPYEIIAPIGFGGMGEVYRARDTRLNRLVAVKVIRSDLAWRQELRQRFEREAQTISSLNHPHICALFDVGHQDDIDYLVMEYLEGETLAHRLQRGPLPASEVVEVGIAIASALDKAHQQNLVHRDLKPGNVMLTKNGAKLMDFGLAKPIMEAVEAIASNTTDPSPGPARLTPITSEGSIIGTFQYMAPEVLEGTSADKRSDVFSLGCVLYEMITGKPAFTGKSRISVLAAIIQSQPEPLAQLQPMTPAAIDRIVRGCMEKDPDRRWQSASDIAMELSWVAQPENSGVLQEQSRKRRWMPWALTLLMALGLTFALTFPPSHPKPPFRRYNIVLPSAAALAPPNYMPLGVGRSTLAISANGDFLVYVGVAGDTTALFVRTNDGHEPRILPGTERAHSPFLSPDNHWVGFFAGEKMKKVAVEGGTPLNLCDADLGFGGSWAPDNWIYFTPGESSQVYRVSANGGIPEVVSGKAPGPYIAQAWPEVLPGAQGILLSNSRSGIGIYRLASNELKWLTLNGSFPRWSPTGHIVYVDEGVLWALPFNLKKLDATGPPLLLGEQVRMEQQGAAQFALTSDGTLVYARGGDITEASLVWVDRKGAVVDIGLPLKRFGEFRISPDNKSLAVSIRDQTRYDLWLFDFERQTLSRLTHDGRSRAPLWAPDGSRIIYLSYASGKAEIRAVTPDGSQMTSIVVMDNPTGYPTSTTPDGRSVAIRSVTPGSASIWLVDIDSGKKHLLWEEPFDEGFPAISPDGRWIAYFSNESGRGEVYVRPLTGRSPKWRVTTDGGEEPIWSGDSRKLFYRNRDTWMEVDISSGTEFHAGRPREVMTGPYINIPGYSYDVARDGRFLLLKSEYQALKITQLEVIESWPELLKPQR